VRVCAADSLRSPITHPLPTRCQYRSTALHVRAEEPENRQPISDFANIYIYIYIYTHTMYGVLSLCLILNIQYTILMGSPVASKGIPIGNIAIRVIGRAGHRGPGCCSLWVVPTATGHSEPQTAWHGQSLPAPIQLESNHIACWYLLLEEDLIVKSWVLSENNKQVWDIFF